MLKPSPDTPFDALLPLPRGRFSRLCQEGHEKLGGPLVDYLAQEQIASLMGSYATAVLSELTDIVVAQLNADEMAAAALAQANLEARIRAEGVGLGTEIKRNTLMATEKAVNKATNIVGKMSGVQGDCLVTLSFLLQSPLDPVLVL